MAGLTPEGWVPKSEAEILTEIEQRQRDAIEPDLGVALDLTEFSLVGRLNRIVAKDIAELWQVGSQLYDMLDTDKVTGAQQDALYSLTGALRKGPTHSTVTATVNLNAGTSIDPGEAVAGADNDPDARFVNVEPMVNAGDAPADVQVLFRSVETGPVPADLGHLTMILTPIAGWNSITNAASADLGSAGEVEDDEEFRKRRVEELDAPGGGNVISIRAKLLGLEDVDAVEILENDTDQVDENGLPPHSIEAIVWGGTDELIVQTLWESRTAGIQAFGSEGPFTVEDPDGNPHSIAFSRPTVRAVWLAVGIETGEGYTDDDALKSYLVAASRSPKDRAYLTVGGDVYQAWLAGAALAFPGVLNSQVSVSLAPITDPAAGPWKVNIGPHELAQLEVGRIAVSALP